MVGEQELKEEEESWCGEEARGDEDEGMCRLPQSPSTPEESNRSPSEEINPSDNNQDLRRKEEHLKGQKPFLDLRMCDSDSSILGFETCIVCVFI